MIMAKMKMYTNKEVAAVCGCNAKTVQQYAQKPQNQINFIGEGRRKIFIWFEEDIERFKNQLKPGPGRPPKL
jgi:hypothetical protein